MVFLGTECSLMAEITNTFVKTLDNSFKNAFNETLTSQLKPNSKQIQEVLHGTAKGVSVDIENKWDERVVATKSATRVNFLSFFYGLRGGGERGITFDSICYMLSL